MSVCKLLDQSTGFLLKNSGVAGAVINEAFGDSQYNSLFFTPYRSVSNVLRRTLDIGTAPILLSVLALEAFAGALFFVAKSLYDVIIGNEQASNDLEISGRAIFLGTSAAIMAIVSPFLHLIDLLFSAITSLVVNDNSPSSSVRMGY